MSKDEFIIIKSLLEKLISVLSNRNPYETFAIWIPLISAFIGALFVLLTQAIMWAVKTRKEKKDNNRELVSEAFRISFLLVEYYKELVMHKVHKQYWYKASVYETDPKNHDLYYQRQHESSEDSFEVNSKIKQLLSDYIKTIKHFQILNGNSKVINETIDKINLFKPRKASNFDGVPDENLYSEAAKEEESLNIEYGKYKEYFDEINSEMESMLK